MCQRYWKWLMRKYLSVYLLLSNFAPHTPLDLRIWLWLATGMDNAKAANWMTISNNSANANVRLWSKRSIVIRLDWNIASTSHFFSCHPFSPLPPSTPAAVSSSSHLYFSNLPLSHVKGWLPLVHTLQWWDIVCIIISIGLYVSGGRKRKTQIQMEEAVGMRSGASGETLSFLWQILDGSWHFVCDKK